MNRPDSRTLVIQSIPLPPRVLRDADIRPVVRAWCRDDPRQVVEAREEVEFRKDGWRATRVDFLVVLGDALGCLEIKGDTDALGERWHAQRKHWEQLFEELWLVTTPKVARRIVPGAGWRRNMVPEWWGLMVARVIPGDSIDEDRLVLEKWRAPSRERPKWQSPQPYMRLKCFSKSALVKAVRDADPGIRGLSRMSKAEVSRIAEKILSSENVHTAFLRSFGGGSRGRQDPELALSEVGHVEE